MSADLVVVLLQVEADRIFDGLRPEDGENTAVGRQDADPDRLGRVGREAWWLY